MSTDKEWTPIPGFIGRYAISKDGEVLSMNYCKSGLPGVLKPDITKWGYHLVTLKRRKRYSVHSLVMLTFVGTRPLGMDINHKNGVRTDNRLENLEYCTRSENVIHSFRPGNRESLKGEKHGRSKLTCEQVLEIKKMLNLKFKGAEIAKLMGVSDKCISDIKRGYKWTHLKEEEGL